MIYIANLIDAFRPASGPPPRTLTPFLIWALRGGFRAISAGSALSMATGALEISSAFLLGYLVDTMLAADPGRIFIDHWGILLAITIFFIVLRPAFFGASSALNSIAIGANINPLVLQRLHRHTLGQSVSFFDDDFTGRIAQKQMQTARAVTDVVVESVNVVAFALASLVGAALMLTTINVGIAGLLTLWLLVYFGLIRWFLPRIRIRSTDRAGARAMVSGQVVDTLTNIKTVKLFAHADHEDEAAISAMHAFRHRSLDYGKIAVGFRFSMMTLAGILPVLLLGATLWFWSKGQATPGDIVTTSTLAIRIAQMTGWVSFTLMTIYSNIGEIEDGIRTLTPPHDVTDESQSSVLPHVKGAIKFDNVSFTYGQGLNGIQDVTLLVSPAEKLGLVGASGAGKSTLVAMLLRLFDLEKGDITIDGQSIRAVSQESLRRQISMVTQETAMFNRSARDNILYGDPNASEAEMVAAAKRAEAHDFILDLQDHMGRRGYDAYLGERGVKLSGGQRQRIALARAILKDAPILVLDEATSALDSETEDAIQSALASVMSGKTVIAIAHRLSTIAHMDRIVVLDQGHIAENGTHLELLAQGGLYADFWARQSGGFLGIKEAV